MKRPLSCNPYFKIWFRPRQTIREIIEYDKNHSLLLFCLLSAAPTLFSNLISLLREYTSALLLNLCVSLLWLPLGSYLILNLFTYLNSISGRWLG